MTPYPFELGTYQRPITTDSDVAKQWFDRGLLWVFGYNHEEAIYCFEQAVKADPRCAMARWGIAYSIGPNYNRWWYTYPQEERAEIIERAEAELAAAEKLKDDITPLEWALIEALYHRFPDDPAIEDFSDWNDAYANAMREVYRAFPDDLDVITLFAEAMMNRTPWQLWDLKSGSVAEGADTAEVIELLDQAFAEMEGAWDHLGLLHLYIHVMEMSPHPERALRHGDRLARLSPEGGHLLHMPTHIDVLCGDYHLVVSRNTNAIEADRKFLDYRGADNFYTYYRCHNYHFRVYGAMFLAQPSVALATADELIENLPESIVRVHGDFLECYVSVKQHAQIRFGLWQDIVDTPLHENPEVFCYTMAIMRYARTVAFANLNRIDDAENEKNLFYEACAGVPESRRVINNTARDVLGVAEQMMLGELEYHKGNHDVAFGHLRLSVERDDSLEYDEPWAWMQPARHALGALLLEQERFDEAEAVYRADLGLDSTLSRACQHPGNIWSLHGLHECLIRRGETVEALHIKQQLDRTSARSEIPVTVSCYCRRK